MGWLSDRRRLRDLEVEVAELDFAGGLDRLDWRPDDAEWQRMVGAEVSDRLRLAGLPELSQEWEWVVQDRDTFAGMTGSDWQAWGSADAWAAGTADVEAFLRRDDEGGWS